MRSCFDERNACAYSRETRPLKLAVNSAWGLGTHVVFWISSTWHPDDYGVELVDAPTQISQESSEGAPCMEFSAVADVEAASQTKVLVDWNLDGVTDFEAPVAETHWGRTSTLVFAPDGWGDKLRFFIRKDTAGHSVLAEIRLRVAHTCAGTRPTLRHVASGNACAADAECESGTCVRNQAPRGKCQ